MCVCVLGCDPVRVCAPGTSVACVGVGGCSGGQVCNAEGSAYGACDCGDRDAGSDAGVVDADLGRDAPADAPVACDPIAQTGCAGTERCAWIDSAAEARCVPDGVVALGGACTTPADGADDCVRGAHCVGGTCATICAFGGSSGCASTEVCVAYDGLFERDGERLGGACVTSCDPVSQLRPDGTSCGAGQGCYMLNATTGTTFVCAGAGTLTVNQEITGTVFANSCAPGLVGLLDAAGIQRCTALCRPVTTSIDAPLGVDGASPFTCSAAGAPSGAECLFAWPLGLTDPPDARLNDIGYCFDRAGRTYDDGDGLMAPWPSCATRLSTDGPDSDTDAEHREIGCAPY